MERYIVTMLPNQTRWVILDRYLGGYCTLPDDKDPSSLLPLEWTTKAAADAWLFRCRETWKRWDIRRRPTPEGWWRQQKVSPFDQGMHGYQTHPWT